jgi:Leucine-rich repeat (LRR) protein
VYAKTLAGIVTVVCWGVIAPGSASAAPVPARVAPAPNAPGTGTSAEPAETERAAVVRIEKRGGRVERDKTKTGAPVVMVAIANIESMDDLPDLLAAFKHLRHLKISGPGLTDADFAQLAALPVLDLIEIAGAITDEGMKHLKSFKSLRGLSIDCTGKRKVTDAGLQWLKDVPELQQFQVRSDQITDAGLSALEAVPNLTLLALPSSRVTLADTLAVGQLKKLKVLSLINCPITDAGMKEIGKLTTLESLYLGMAPITDTGLAELTPLSNLQLLYLDSCLNLRDACTTIAGFTSLRRAVLTDQPVTDEGLMKLAGLPNLEFLNIIGTWVTPDGVKEFQKRCPNVSLLQ